MNGPEHYREAERLVHLAENTIGDTRYSDDHRAQWTAEAQVHATLALTAATVAPIVRNTNHREHDEAWQAVTR